MATSLQNDWLRPFCPKMH